MKVHEWEPAKAPFERVHVDYAGPFMNTNFFVLVDAFFKWPFVYTVKDITAKTIIDKCKKMLINFGCPETIVMDNGRNFQSTEFLQFLETNRITPKFTAPYHPATNGQAERFVQTLKNALRKIFADPRNRDVILSDALCNFLVQYRITPHCTTGIAPSERMFKRQMRTHLTLSLPNKPKTITSVNTNKKFREFVVGETVRCRNYSGKIKWKRGRIAQRIGKLHYRVALEDG